MPVFIHRINQSRNHTRHYYYHHQHHHHHHYVWSMKWRVPGQEVEQRKLVGEIVEKGWLACKPNREDAVDRNRWRKQMRDGRWPREVWVGECSFWYWLTWVVLDKIQRAIKWLCVCVCVCVYRPDLVLCELYEYSWQELITNQHSSDVRDEGQKIIFIDPESVTKSSVWCCFTGAEKSIQ